MKRRHVMPFGAEYLGDGRTRFRLWAPAVERMMLELRTADRDAAVDMKPVGEGWHECTVQTAPGTGYRYRLPDGRVVPDPASRYSPGDADEHAMVVDPLRYEWRDAGWRGRPWHETVIYEAHVGAATAEGTYVALERRLGELAALGVTAVELMPLGDFPGARNWGYDGVLPFAPDASYGTPDELKHFIDAAHAHGLMVFIDVVYNHFGPEGNYLPLYAPQFFTERHHTPWGAAINYDGAASKTVREFFIHNALYWLEEFHVDGLRLDAVHEIADDGPHHILAELAERVRSGPGRDRHVHLVLENDKNRASLLQRAADGRPRWYDAQWNDDFHHAFHVLLAGERDGYYADYAQRTTEQLARCLAEGCAYQGEPSAHRKGQRRGEPSGALPPTAFVSFLQNHDQVGNRAHGERIAVLAQRDALRAAVCAWLLSPQIPLLFMGEEYGLETPFLFFCDFHGDLARAVREGRRNEFAQFAAFASDEARARIADPGAEETFQRSKLPLTHDASHRSWYAFYAKLLALRRAHVVPLLQHISGHAGQATVHGYAAVSAVWRAEGAELELRMNLSDRRLQAQTQPAGRVIHVEPPETADRFETGELPPYAAAVYLRAAAS
ncbi:MAG: malto-oligosyltrehalose trehalohydrolase [Rhodospirillaceae bacterium]